MQVSQRFEVDKDGKNATALLPRNMLVSQRYVVNKGGKNATALLPRLCRFLRDMR